MRIGHKPANRQHQDQGRYRVFNLCIGLAVTSAQTRTSSSFNKLQFAKIKKPRLNGAFSLYRQISSEAVSESGI